jgi:cytochrome c oxidase subunit 2
MHLHRYEKYWLIFGVGTLVVFLSVIGFTAFAHGHHPPSHMATVDAQNVKGSAPFDEPGLKQIDENTYEATIIAMTFGYEPNKITVPKGSTVRFQVTSQDVVHSFTIPMTNVNMMITPGHINQSEHTFKEAGSYLVLCNEYCGIGHQHMQMEIEVTEE